MVEVSLIKLPSWSCLQINVTELTENPTLVQVHLMTRVYIILSCNRAVVADQSAISWGPIGNRLAIGRRLVGDCILGVCFWLQKVCNFLKIGRQPIGDQSATKIYVGNVCNRCNWSAISRPPVGNLSATTKNLSTIDLVAERFHLQQPKPPCDQIVPATFCNRSATSRRLPCNHPATTRNFGRKEVADRLQAMCDRGFIQVYMTGRFLSFRYFWHQFLGF